MEVDEITARVVSCVVRVHPFGLDGSACCVSQ